MQLPHQSTHFGLLGDVSEQMCKQEPAFFSGWNRKGADIQPNHFAGLGVGLDIEVAHRIATAEPVPDRAQGRAERLAAEGFASHDVVTRATENFIGPKPQQPLCGSVPQHDDPSFVGQHRTIGGPVEHIDNRFHR